MYTMFRGLLCLALLASLVVVAGCKPAGPDIDAYPVTGKVTLNGSPVAGATVTFVPSGEGKSAVGMTDDTGTYTLKTYDGVEGAPAGEYKVKIVKYEGGAAPAEAAPPPSGEDQEYSEDYAGAEEETAEPKNLLPEKYADESSSGLTATVTEGENSIDFELSQ